LVRPGGGEVALEMIGRRRFSPIGDRGAHTLAASPSALDAQLAHQPGGALLPDPDATVDTKPGGDPGRAVGVTAALIQRQDLELQLIVAKLASAWWSPLPGLVALPGDLKHRAQQGDGVVRPLLVDQPEGPHGRSVSLAK
jgi:hypothetical protein